MQSNVLADHIAAYLRQNVYTSIPAVVLEVGELQSQQTVTVQPLIDRVFSDDVVMEPATIYNVPVVFPAAGGGLLSFPIEVGDTVLLKYSMRSLEEWLDSFGENVTPSDNRHYHKTDGIAIPGLFTKKTNLSPNPVDVELKFNDLHLLLEAGGDITLSNPAGSLKLKPSGQVLHSSGAQITPSGDFITASGVSLDLHVHTQGVDSDGDVQPPTNPPTV